MKEMIQKTKNKNVLFILAFLIVAAFFLFQYQKKSEAQNTHPRSEKKLEEREQAVDTKHIPQKVYDVLNYITLHKQAMPNYVGGRIFQNREKKLPIYSSNQIRINYQEWDVNPKKEGINRGSERLISSDIETAYYTNNHYRTFIKIK